MKQHFGDGAPELVDLVEMLRAGERAAALTAQLLAFSRGQVIGRDRVDLNAVLRDLAGTLVPLIGADVKLVLDVPLAAAPIFADRGQIEQVIMNLVVNARDAMPRGRNPHARDLAARGRDRPPSADGRPSPAREASAPERAAVTTQREAVAHGTETLLLVEDETALRKAVAEMLGDHGYHVIATPGPLEALRLIEDPSRNIDLLLTDLVMPTMGGVELARRVLASRPEVRVLFVSGYAPEGVEREKMLVEKRAAFLGKPFQPDELLRRIRRLHNG